MYQEEYKRWMAADLEDPDLKPELMKIEGSDDEIKERFAVSLKFGTAGAARRPRGGHEPHEYLCGPPGYAGTGQLGEDPGRHTDRGDQL